MFKSQKNWFCSVFREVGTVKIRVLTRAVKSLPLDPPAYLQSFWQRALLFGLGPVDELSCRTYLASRLKHLYKEIREHSSFLLVTGSINLLI